MTQNGKAAAVAGGLWAIVLLGFDGGYVASHGVDITALITALFAVAPAWVFLAKDIDFSFLGSKLKITSAELAQSTEQLAQIVPKEVERAKEELPQRKEAIQGGSSVPEDDMLIQAAFKDGIAPLLSSGISRLPAPKAEHSEEEVQSFFSDLAKNVTPEMLADIDPNLALVNLRIEIERRVNSIMEILKLRRLPLIRAIDELRRRDVFRPEFADSLLEYVRYGNDAAHGASVEKEAAKQILKSQAYILTALDSIYSSIDWANDEMYVQ